MSFTYEAAFTDIQMALAFIDWFNFNVNDTWSSTIEDDYINVVCEDLTFRELRMCGDMEDQLRKTEGDTLNASTN